MGRWLGPTFDKSDLRNSLNAEYLGSDSVSLKLQTQHLGNCYLRPAKAPKLGFEDMIWASAGRFLAWASKSHKQVHVIGSLSECPRGR